MSQVQKTKLLAFNCCSSFIVIHSITIIYSVATWGELDNVPEVSEAAKESKRMGFQNVTHLLIILGVLPITSSE